MISASCPVLGFLARVDIGRQSIALHDGRQSSMPLGSFVSHRGVPEARKAPVYCFLSEVRHRRVGRKSGGLLHETWTA